MTNNNKPLKNIFPIGNQSSVWSRGGGTSNGNLPKIGMREPESATYSIEMAPYRYGALHASNWSLGQCIPAILSRSGQNCGPGSRLIAGPQWGKIGEI